MGETVSPWLPRGNGAEMDSCYQHRDGDNWGCLPAQWLHPASPSPATATEKYGLLSCYYGSFFLSLLGLHFIRGCSPICPHSLVLNTGRKQGHWDASKENDKSQFDL
ncbi:unnamed protein product [Pleuronectes platessa]|uniref:Uncharacterized protein n=1 Tax=Pleuronectes platessa TaxID=8262 RepID=A0A9N7VRE4_PLEPL|nr:unnamed protein product [Pleuronectes platessa]